jgi:fluoride ion exporter CrcB/FEX
MNATPWKVVIAIVLGSAAGALLRQATIILLGAAAASSISVTLVVSGIGGLVLGAAMGWVATAIATEAVRRQLATIALVAGLGTFAAGAVLSAPLPSSEEAHRMLYSGGLNIGTAILTAAIGLGVARRLRSR